MFHTGLHDQYHRPSDDVQLINFEGIEPVARLTLDFLTALANDPGPLRPFRAQARSESDATKRALEAPTASTAAPQTVAQPALRQGQPALNQGQPALSQGQPALSQRPRWGIGTRADPGEPGNPVIVRITAASPAAQAGIMLGDRVIAIDGTTVTNQADMVARLAAAGSSVAIDVDRKGRVVRLDMAATQP